MNGKTVKMPMRLSEFLEKFDLVIEEEYKKVTLDKDEYTFIVVEKRGDSSSYLFVDVANVTGQDEVSVNDCVVFCLEADKYDLYEYDGETKFDIVLPGNVVVNKTTEDEVLAIYGTPDETRTTDESDYIHYVWNLGTKSYDDYSFIEIEVEKETDLVIGFEYSVMP
jgi:hypothetical protein